MLRPKTHTGLMAAPLLHGDGGAHMQIPTPTSRVSARPGLETEAVAQHRCFVRPACRHRGFLRQKADFDVASGWRRAASWTFAHGAKSSDSTAP